MILDRNGDHRPSALVDNFTISFEYQRYGSDSNIVEVRGRPLQCWFQSVVDDHAGNPAVLKLGCAKAISNLQLAEKKITDFQHQSANWEEGHNLGESFDRLLECVEKWDDQVKEIWGLNACVEKETKLGKSQIEGLKQLWRGNRTKIQEFFTEHGNTFGVVAKTAADVLYDEVLSSKGHYVNLQYKTEVMDERFDGTIPVKIGSDVVVNGKFYEDELKEVIDANTSLIGRKVQECDAEVRKSGATGFCWGTLSNQQSKMSFKTPSEEIDPPLDPVLGLRLA